MTNAMRKIYSLMLLVILAIFTSIAFASESAQKCANLQCVRNNIDQINRQIVSLLGERLQYVKRAGELKKHTKSVHDQAREDAILKAVGEQATTAGYPASIAQAVFKTILQQSNVYEKTFHTYNATNTNELTQIQNSGVLKVCTTGDYPPITQYVNGKYHGEAIQKAKALAKYLNVKVEFIKTTWPNLSRDVAMHKCDIAMGGISASPSRAKSFLLTKPVLSFGKVPLVRCADVKKYQSLQAINKPNVRVVENIGGTNLKFAQQNLPKAKLIIVKNNKLPFVYLQQNKADVMITDNIEAVYKQKTTPGLCAVNPNKPFTQAYKVYMLPKDSENLLAEVNKWLAS